MKYAFINDYSEGAHEKIMEAMVSTNRKQTVGYGMDEYCARAAELISAHLHNPKSKVHFLVGGTQTNLTVISSILRPHQGAISADTGHINTHESGAIEATGHKVLTIPSPDGKITAEQVKELVEAHINDATFEHTVQPGMVYISHPTEVGTIYSKKELTELRAVCDQYELPLFVDGARLGCALTAEDSDVTLFDLAHLSDLFYIGGTKMGALFGEALVINNPALQKDFRYQIKQKGGMLAKGRLLGIQFEQLFTDDLYFELAKHANRMASKLREGIAALGYAFFAESPTNQIFPVLPRTLLEKLGEDYGFAFWCRVDDTHDAIRLCCSWATDEEMVDELLKDLKKLS